MPLEQHDWAKQAEIVRQAGTSNFVELIRMSGLDPAIDLRFADWSEVDFDGCDLAGFDFTGARLCGCNFNGSKIAGARFDASEIDQVRLYTGNNTNHNPQNPRTSPLRTADDWDEYCTDWVRQDLIINGGGMINGGDFINATNFSDNHLSTGAIFQDAPIAPEMVIISPGVFTTRPSGVDKDSNEQPQQEISIPDRLAVSRYAITFEEWDVYVDDKKKPKPDDEGWGRGPNPVMNVSSQDIDGYIEWLCLKTGKPYRLLTESEWEYNPWCGHIKNLTFAQKVGHAVLRKNTPAMRTFMRFVVDNNPFILWASPPCQAFSVAAIGHNWNRDRTPKHPRAIQAQLIVLKTLEIIHARKPDWWFIENPRGMLRKIPFMKSLTRHTISYCQYGDTRQKADRHMDERPLVASPTNLFPRRFLP